jgi:hypothetical protein
MPSRNLTALFTFLLVLARPFAVSAAEAPDAKAGDAADPVAKIQQLNRAGMQYFDDLNYAMAEKSLLEALALVDKANLASGPAGLSTHGNLGVLYSAGFKKPDKSVFHFKKALAIKPDLKLSKQRSSPETEANLARAKAEMAGGPKAGVAVGPREDAASGEALSCPTEGEVQAGDEITFKCTTSGAIKVASVTLHYKPNDGEEFQALQMAKESSTAAVTTWIAKVPGAHTQGTMVPFFVAANDPSGETLAISGREDNPSIIIVKGAGVAAGPPPVAAGGEAEEEEEEGEDFDDKNPLAQLERERWREHQGSKGSWLISAGAGSGLGYASGKSTEAFGKYGVGFNSGVAPASLGHLVWEVAYFVGRQTAMSIGGRHQGIFGGPKGTATGAHSLLVRTLFFTEDEGKVRWYFALAAGGGEGFRLRVEASIKDSETGDNTGYTVKDTVRGGPFVAGFGGGMLYKIGRRWHLSLDSQALVGIPHASAVVDLTAGLRWQH